MWKPIQDFTDGIAKIFMRTVVNNLKKELKKKKINKKKYEKELRKHISEFWKIVRRGIFIIILSVVLSLAVTNKLVKKKCSNTVVGIISEKGPNRVEGAFVRRSPACGRRLGPEVVRGVGPKVRRSKGPLMGPLFDSPRPRSPCPFSP